MAPALHDADRAGLGDLMQRFQDLVKRSRAGSLRSSELSDPTITVTSLGEQGWKPSSESFILRKSPWWDSARCLNGPGWPMGWWSHDRS